MATATDYLPWPSATTSASRATGPTPVPIEAGKSSVMLLVDQLDLLGTTMDKVYDAVCRADAEAIIVHGAFLEQKFGQASTGGALGLGPDPVQVSPPRRRRSGRPHGPARRARRLPGVPRVAPPVGPAGMSRSDA